jgi:hypothetical protein
MGVEPIVSQGPSRRTKNYGFIFSAPFGAAFKCAASGNQLDLWAQASRKSLFDAALDLCTHLNKEAPRLTPATEKRNP